MNKLFNKEKATPSYKASRTISVLDYMTGVYQHEKTVDVFNIHIMALATEAHLYHWQSITNREDGRLGYRFKRIYPKDRSIDINEKIGELILGHNLRHYE
ncbi:MAG: hypothetical protein COA96_15035 [SAR86 cluster bacterium]|uniref:Uncharacterized protein n=1 Tax=SAR86 cluster bacterium TaxID=2030880 RepID=A0A2A5ART5_9GAMM|nr:MAG: hypothetical protein COA96_15035 [SAR86 cluster bacterium]